MEVFLWRLFIGALAGILASLITGEGDASLPGAVVLGVLGAFVGGWLFARLGIPIGAGIWWDLLISFVGALALLILLRMVRRTA